MVKKAGIILATYQDDQLLLLFMMPSNSEYGGPDWQIAKGQIDPGEQPLESR